MSPLSRRFLFFAAIVSALAVAGWGADVAADRRYQLAVVEPTPLLSMSPLEYTETNPPLVTLQPGQPVKVLRMRYGKDFQTFKIETTSGTIGWVIEGQGVRVVSAS